MQYDLNEPTKKDVLQNNQAKYESALFYQYLVTSKVETSHQNMFVKFFCYCLEEREPSTNKTDLYVQEVYSVRAINGYDYYS